MAEPERAEGAALPSAVARAPRTERGTRTRRALLDAAAAEFGARGFHATGISDITRRAGVALGTFYTWFSSKEEIFRALVADLSARVRDAVAPRLADEETAIGRERAALLAFLEFVAENQHIYRVIDEAEFVDAQSHRTHYETTVARIARRLAEGAAAGELRADVGEVEAWAIAGMNVFLGLRYAVWSSDRPADEIARRANRLLSEGLRRNGWGGGAAGAEPGS